MTIFGTIPPEPPAITSLDGCCPRLRRDIPVLVERMNALGMPTKIRETKRTNARQLWLHGFGRLYDDDRGVVTNASTAFNGWHFFGGAADLVHATLEDDAPKEYWDALAKEAEGLGLTAGRRWTSMRGGEGDRPHVQVTAQKSPTQNEIDLYESDGLEAVWAKTGML